VVLATASYDHTIRLWEATSGVCHRTLQYADSQVNKLEITSDKQFLAAAGNPHVRLFEVNSSNGQPVSSYDGHQGNVTAVGFQRDNKWMFTGSEDGTVKIWDLRAPGYQRQYESRAAVNTVALHPNQGELISGDQNGNIRVWDLRENLCSSEYVPEVGTAVRSISVASDGSLAVAANNSGTCFVWQLVNKGEAGPAGASQGVTHFEPLHKLQAHDGKVLKCLLSPDVQHLATTSSDNTIKIWQLDGFGLKQTLVGHQKWVWDCVFSVDAAYLVTASSDCTARLWDLSASEAIRVYSGHHKAVVCCALNDSSEGT
jgi:G protein beta subunit-like protein